MNNFISAMNFRHACKVFDNNKKITKEDFETILEAGRLTPSSFGLEPTRLIVLQNNEIREKIKPLCWNQEQITTSSQVVVFKSKVADLQADTNYVFNHINQRMKDEAKTKAYLQRFGNFLINNNITTENMIHWTAKQAYLMASSMMNCAAFMGIDSCPMEGFDQKKLEEFFNIDTFSERIVLIVAFGYRVNPQSQQYRISMQELVEYK